MPSAAVVVVSDSHLSERAAEAESNWRAVVRCVRDLDAEMVVHLGDLSLDGADNADDLLWARSRLDQLPCDWLAVPGNHDIGDNPSPSASPAVDGDRLERWRRMIGPDRWHHDLGDWTLVGINAQLFGSGLAAEAEQWQWLVDLLAGPTGRRPVALVTHKPLTAAAEELATSPGYRFVPSAARGRLEALMGDHQVPLVLSGHVHQHRVLTGPQLGSRRHVWAPTTWAVLPEQAQATVGLKRCGILVVDLSDDGAAGVHMVEPEGMAQLTLISDIPDPYSH